LSYTHGILKNVALPLKTIENIRQLCGKTLWWTQQSLNIRCWLAVVSEL